MDPKQQQQHHQKGGGGGKGGAQRGIEAAANLLGSALGTHVSNRPAAQRVAAWLKRNFDPTAVSSALSAAQVLVPSALSTPAKLVDFMSRMGLSRSDAAEVVDDFTTDAFITFFSGLASQSSNPSAVYQTTEQEVEKLCKVEQSRREGMGPHQAVGYLATEDLRERYKRILDILTVEERAKLQKLMAESKAKIVPEELEGILRLHSDPTIAKLYVTAILFGSSDKPQPKTPLEVFMDNGNKFIKTVGAIDLKSIGETVRDTRIARELEELRETYPLLAVDQPYLDWIRQYADKRWLTLVEAASELLDFKEQNPSADQGFRALVRAEAISKQITLLEAAKRRRDRGSRR